jgi:hypothetical protein
MKLFGKYPYLISYISVSELSQQTNTSRENLEKFLKELQKEAEEKERKKLEKRWMEKIFEEEEEVFIY